MKSEKGVILQLFLIIIAVMLIVILASVIINNTNYGEREGIVIDKQYHSAYTTTMYIYAGKVLMPTTQYYPEKWEIQIKKKIDEEEKTIWTSVDENTYNNIEIGDYYIESE